VARLIYLDRDGVERIAHSLAEELFSEYGSPLPEFRLIGQEGIAALESALGLPRQPYYRTIFDKAGALLRSLIMNHPLVDGNKRIGMTATFVFLLLNDRLLVASNEEMVEYALRIADETPDPSWREIAAWLREKTIVVPKTREQVDEAVEALADRWIRPGLLLERIAEYRRALDAPG